VSSRQEPARPGGAESSRPGRSSLPDLSSIPLSATEARSTPGPRGILGGVTVNLGPVRSDGGRIRASSSSSTGGAGFIRRNGASSRTGAWGGSTPSSSAGLNGSGETGSLSLTRTGPDRLAFLPASGGEGASTRSPKRSSEVASPSSSCPGGMGASLGLRLLMAKGRCRSRQDRPGLLFRSTMRGTYARCRLSSTRAYPPVVPWSMGSPERRARPGRRRAFRVAVSSRVGGGSRDRECYIVPGHPRGSGVRGEATSSECPFCSAF
jgi:hypothetical protein